MTGDYAESGRTHGRGQIGESNLEPPIKTRDLVAKQLGKSSTTMDKVAGGVVNGVTRDVQLSIVEGLERPVGPILLSVFAGTNADLVRAVAPIYLTGSVLDITYGGGKWWDRFTPDPFAFHDLTVDGVDFQCLPEADSDYDTVVFDPPYVESGGPSSATLADSGWQDRYGIGRQNLPTGPDALILAGLAEACRVARRFVLVKCMEYAQGGGPKGFHDVPTIVTNAAREHGWVKWDQIVHHSGTGPGGHNIFTVRRARRAHSYLIVFAPARPAAKAAS